MFLSSRKTEEIATNAVSKCFGAVSRISAVVNSLDKEVATDGYLEVYSNPDYKKEHREGKIPIQVKGTCAKIANVEKLKRPVSIADLNIYFLDDGVLYFYVLIDEETRESEVYYKRLLPYDLNEILEGVKEEQKTTTLSFSKFPSSSKQIERLCFDYLRDCALQKNFRNVKPGSGRDLIKCEIPIKEFSFTQTLFQGESPLSFEVFSNGTYVYGKTAWGESYVVDKINPPLSISILVSHEISAGDYAFEMSVTIKEDSTGIKAIEFGCFHIALDEEVQLTYKDEGTLTQRYQSAAILKGLLQTEELYFDGSRLASGLRVSADNELDINELYKQYERLYQLKEMLAIKIEWNLDGLSEDDVNKLNALVHCFVLKQKLHPKHELEQFFCATIGENCCVFITKGSVEEGYEIYDILSPDLCFVFGISEQETPKDDKIYPVPALFTFTVDDMVRVANIDAERFAASLNKYPIIDATAGQASLKLLDMISAYDKNPVCADDLYECCLDLANRLVELDPTSDIAEINRLQVKKRRQQLDSEEKDILLSYVANASDLELRASAAILLDKNDIAEKIIDSLEENERETFMAWPIAELQKRNFKAK